ncbi:hypothetical protein TRAPUB_9462 [Trametes pubescens]|uniref:Uncharacterized protein n=1 Tax=Trametes pubescens TaxID=154538 RepID=A0A1M2W299_TRAPU|nr:hypothetical protein TRAPUB_9462 [Trametes pubescens]
MQAQHLGIWAAPPRATSSRAQCTRRSVPVGLYGGAPSTGMPSGGEALREMRLRSVPRGATRPNRTSSLGSVPVVGVPVGESIGSAVFATALLRSPS